MPVRKITNKGSRTKVIGLTPSYKMGRSIVWESPLERDYIFLLEFDSGVISYEEQPQRFYYRWEGKEHRYTPDFLVIRKDKKQIVEVKPEKKASQDKYQLLFKLVAPVIEMEGYQFRVVTEQVIRLEPQLSNIKCLRTQGRVAPSAAQQVLAHEHLQSHPLATVASLRTEFEQRQIPIQMVYSLIYWGMIAIDLNQSLTLSTRIYPPTNRK